MLIVASGPSAERVPKEMFRKARDAGVYVIAVNGASDFCPSFDCWFTLDPSDHNKKIMASPRACATYYAAVPDDYGSPHAKHALHREPAERGIVYLRRLKRPVGRGLSGTRHGVASGNSAFGALNIAFLLGAQKIAMIGVDGSREAYAFGSRLPRKNFNHLPNLFKTAMFQLKSRKIEVINGSPKSFVTCFPRRDPLHAIRWLMDFSDGD